MMHFKKIPVILVICFAICLSVAYTAFSLLSETRRPNLPIYGPIYDFRLIDEKGEEFSLSNLKGNIWIADFFFTTCGSICPVMSKNMAALHRSFELVDGVSMVSITVNPEIDSSD